MRILTVVAGIVLVFGSLLVTGASAAPIGALEFQRTWNRTDKPVADEVVERTWMWGPDAFSDVIEETYDDAPGGRRLVQYFDKSRMEDNSYRGIDPWDVTNGLLVVEMVDGKIQFADGRFDESPSPADVNIAGDPGERPTYADINRLNLRAEPSSSVSSTIIATYSDDNVIRNDPAFGRFGVTAAVYVAETQHTVASPFWAFMNSTGSSPESSVNVLHA